MLTELLGRWTARHNRRRLAEEVLGLCLQLIALLAATQLLGPKALWLAAPMVAWAATRLWRRRSSVQHHAARLDRALEQRDLLATALALEAGEGRTALASTVLSRAYEVAPQLDPGPVEPFVFPVRSATVALVALGVTVLWEPIARLPEALAAQEPETGASPAKDPFEALPDPEREAIARLQEEVAELSRIPHLSDEAKERLLAAEEALARVAEGQEGGTQALTSLGQAEDLLDELADEADDEELFEKDKLKTADNDELAEALAEAMERGDTELAAELLEEAGRRIDEAPGGAQLGELGEALMKASSGEEGDPLMEAGELLKEGKRGEASRSMEKTGKGLKKGRGKDSGDKLGELSRRSKRAKERQMSRMMGETPEGEAGEGGEGGEPGPGTGETRRVVAGIDDAGGEPGDGGIDLGGGAMWDGDGGEPGTSHGPGEAENKGTEQAGLKADSEWIESLWSGAPETLLDTVDGHARGEDGDPRFVEVHRAYSNVAEAAGEDQDLPLTRRELARDYFEEIKP